MPGLLHKYLWQSTYMTGPEFEAAIRERNNNFQGVFLKAGQNYIIPGMVECRCREDDFGSQRFRSPRDLPDRRDGRERSRTADHPPLARSRRQRRGIRHQGFRWQRQHSFRASAAWAAPYIHDLPKFIHFLHSENMHAIARIAIFRDEHLVTKHPELAVQSRRTGQPWRENGKLVWTDPSNPRFRITTSRWPNS